MKEHMRRMHGLAWVVVIALGGWAVSTAARADLTDDIEDLEKPKPAPTKRPDSDSKPMPVKPGAKPKPKKAAPAPASAPVEPTKPAGLNPGEAPAKPAATKSKDGSREPINWESKGLKGSKDQGTLELVDDVVVTQADLRIEASHATVFFNQATNEVIRVVATGNVKIFKNDVETQQKIRAEGNEAIFQNLERLVTLKGAARLWRGDDLVRGKQITYELNTGWIRADRVEGVVQPHSEKAPAGKGTSEPKVTPAASEPTPHPAPTQQGSSP